MNDQINIGGKYYQRESGAALVTVLMVSVLLGIACIALLSSVGANSRNSTDVLSETKAYYAAESGLQSTINVLRNNPSAKYSLAAGSPHNLSNLGLTYNCSGTVSVGGTNCTDSETFYSVYVTDPDNAGNSTTFSTAGSFTNANALNYETSNGSNKFVFTFTPVSNCTINFVANTTCDGRTNPLLGTLNIQKVGDGGNFNENVRFSIDYAITAPRQSFATISGTINKQNTATDVSVTFSTNQALILGSTVTLCQDPANSCPIASSASPFVLNPTQANNTTITVPIYMKTTPVEPFRLKVLSTGYGPNKAKKQLEAIIQANLLNDESAPAAFTLQGPVSATSFRPGTSGAFQILGQDNVGGISQPAIGVIDQTSLTNVNNSITNPNSVVSPAPAIVSSVPSWMSTPQKLDLFVNSMRQAALTSSPQRYFTGLNQPTSYGDNATGTGLTFCDGDCTAPGNTSGGGTLVVTGKFITNGTFNFRGLILIVGPLGMERQGNGCGVIQGSLVIAPYNTASLTSNTFTLPPTYNSNGSGCSTFESDSVALATAFNGTNALTDLMLGVAEK